MADSPLMPTLNACPRCGSAKLIPLTYTPPPGHRVETDPVAAHHQRPQSKCVGCGHRITGRAPRPLGFVSRELARWLPTREGA